jgi:hypothetical protein
VVFGGLTASQNLESDLVDLLMGAYSKQEHIATLAFVVPPLGGPVKAGTTNSACPLTFAQTNNPDRSAELSPSSAAALRSCEWISGARRNRRAFAWRFKPAEKYVWFTWQCCGGDPNSEHMLLENGAIPCSEADA